MDFGDYNKKSNDDPYNIDLSIPKEKENNTMTKKAAVKPTKKKKKRIFGWLRR